MGFLASPAIRLRRWARRRSANQLLERAGVQPFPSTRSSWERCRTRCLSVLFPSVISCALSWAIRVQVVDLAHEDRDPVALSADLGAGRFHGRRGRHAG